MKNKYLLFCLFIITTLSSCKKTEYTQAIPSDAAAVISIDMKSIAAKSGINDQENLSLKQHLTEALKNGLNSETSDRISNIMDDPSESGFDFKKPVYIYTAKEFDYTPVVDISVCDKGDLTSTIKALSKSQLCTEPQETDHYKFTIIGGKAILAYNRGTALCIESKEGMTEKIRTVLDKVMTLKKEQSFRSNNAFDDLNKRDKDINFYASTKQSSSVATAIHSSSDITLIGDANFENGRILLTIEKYDKKDKQSPSGANNFRPVSNALLTNLPQHMPIMFTVGINGAETYKELSSDSMLGLDMLDIPILEKLFESVQGDLTIGYNSFGKSEPAFLAYAQIKDASSVKNIYGYIKKSKDDTWGTLDKKDENDYVYHFAKHNIFYGIRGNILYITNDASLIHYKVSGNTYAQNTYAPQAKGKDLFFVFDASEIAEQPTIQKKIGNVASSAIEKNIVCIRGYNTSANSWNVEMIWKDKNTNTLKQMIRVIRQIAGM